jgi:hypothetical protein
VLVEPESERLPNSAVLFADIRLSLPVLFDFLCMLNHDLALSLSSLSGFTTLAERLAKKGEAEGAEVLVLLHNIDLFSFI